MSLSKRLSGMEVAKPVSRKRLRYVLSREWNIINRKLLWVRHSKQYAIQQKSSIAVHEVFKHQSVILRPLRDVDMLLQENKRTNLFLAAAKVDGIVIAPGQTFSFWKAVGRPTRRKGYLTGLVLSGGKIGSGTGGGLCQMGNLLFWMFMHSPLTITERHRHSFDVFPDQNRTIPFGAGATLAYNYIDLQVYNGTNHYFQINLWMDEINLNGRLLCSEKLDSHFRVEERDHVIRQEKWGGYSRHNRIVRLEQTKEGVETENFSIDNHALLMYSPFLQESPLKSQ